MRKRRTGCGAQRRNAWVQKFFISNRTLLLIHQNDLVLNSVEYQSDPAFNIQFIK